MEVFIGILLFALGFVVGVLTACFIALNRIKKMKDTAQFYCDMYLEAAETIKDLVVYDVDFVDSEVENG